MTTDNTENTENASAGQTANVPESTSTPTPTNNSAETVQQPAGITAADGAALLGAINALPERIVNSIREATQPAKPARAPQSETPKRKEESATQQETKREERVTDNQPGKPRSFSDWWWGR